MKYKIAKLTKKTGEPVTVSSDPEGELIELDPASGAKYALTVDIGNLPPREAVAYVNKIKDQISEFFGKGNLLLIPRRSDGTTQIEIFELKPDEPDARENVRDIMHRMRNE